MKSIIATLLVLLVAVSSCKKDAVLRTQSYTIVPQNSSGITGTVTFKELTDATQTQVDIQLQHTIWNSMYICHIHDGPPTNYHGASFIFDAYAVGNQLSYQKNIALSYDSALRYDGTFVVHDSTGTQLLGRCGIGKNG